MKAKMKLMLLTLAMAILATSAKTAYGVDVGMTSSTSAIFANASRSTRFSRRHKVGGEARGRSSFIQRSESIANSGLLEGSDDR